ncbi:hypothetical protein F5B19DRAFT_399552 [Rostrohypoxylon terebratum]|nr:hypothetical protein F5B19DRAFT_399552 [Rostrohypoxylon terebratum]
MNKECFVEKHDISTWPWPYRLKVLPFRTFGIFEAMNYSIRSYSKDSNGGARGNGRGSYVYSARPYLAQAYCLSEDSLEDDVCVWDDGPTFSEINISEEQFSFYEPTDPIRNQKNAKKDASPATPRDFKSESEGGMTVRDVAGLTDEQRLERKTADALLATQRNLTRVLQFILKLERRAGKVTKEGIRQTLDATVANSTNVSGQDDKLTRCEEIENLQTLSENAWQRLYLVDRHWRKEGRQECNAQETEEGPKIQIESEPSIKSWLKEEMRINDTVGEDPCYYTVADLASGRSFVDWIVHLMDVCELADDPEDEAKLIELAWRFLDRSLRGPRPNSAMRVSDFILELEGKVQSGAFEEALENPGKQVEEDAEAWKNIRRCMGSRIHRFS